MEKENLLDRITSNESIFGGKPIIKNRRVAVEHITGMLRQGAKEKEILDAYPFLAREDIDACKMWEEQRGAGSDEK